MTSSPKAPFVLVHGAWGGAWIWRRVLGPLRAAGHEVHAVTLTGDGERAHLRTPAVGLKTHIADVVGLVTAEELSGIVLVGHSYGGLVVTGAADALLARDPRSVRRLVYIDAMVPEPGECWSSLHSAETKASRTAAAAANDHALPPPDPSGFGLGAEDHAWLARRQVPHPFAPYTERLDFSGERLASIPRLFVDCTQPAYPTIQPVRERVRRTPGFRVAELATGHCPMVSTPQALVQLLLAEAAG